MPPVESEIRPREVADKSSKQALLAALRMTLDVESAAVRRNTQTFNRNHYRATSQISDYQQLKDRARAIKEQAIANLPALLERLEAAIRARGGNFFLAGDASEACNYIRNVCQRHNVRSVVKGKSITSEEIHLNRVLEAAGIQVAETDLAEFILQVADEQPSHNVAPALHYSRERITALFKRKFETDLPLDTGEELTKFAREKLRERFLSADCGITGANLIAADTGTIMLVESEGNIRMSYTVPPLHIAIAGVEKVIPAREDLRPFLELLASSATGQPLTSYTSIIRPPLGAPTLNLNGRDVPHREFHLVLIDNGRLRMREDPVFREALYCIRCSACLNVCANFQAVGGHAFGGETYSGGIGGSWEMGTGSLAKARFSELCTGCSRCVPQCPVRIDIPWLNESLRERSNQQGKGALAREAFAGLLNVPAGDRRAPLQKQFFAHYDAFAKWGSRFASLSNWALSLSPVRLLMEKTLGVDRRRELVPFTQETWIESARKRPRPARVAVPAAKAVVIADVFTNYGSTPRGMATLDVLEAAGVEIVLSEAIADGRAALSQGLIATAARQAHRMATMLTKHLAQGRDIVVVEPSVLAMCRSDYRHLLEDPSLLATLHDRSFEAVEYLSNVLAARHMSPTLLFDAARVPNRRVIYHSHCQQKQTPSAQATLELLTQVGFEVKAPVVECCGMAGSFGYKRDFYELSMAVGADLFAQITDLEKNGECILLVSGVSCYEQIYSGTGRRALHPMELLKMALRPVA